MDVGIAAVTHHQHTRDLWFDVLAGRSGGGPKSALAVRQGGQHRGIVGGRRAAHRWAPGALVLVSALPPGWLGAWAASALSTLADQRHAAEPFWGCHHGGGVGGRPARYGPVRGGPRQALIIQNHISLVYAHRPRRAATVADEAIGLRTGATKGGSALAMGAGCCAGPGSGPRRWRQCAGSAANDQVSGKELGHRWPAAARDRTGGTQVGQRFVHPWSHFRLWWTGQGFKLDHPATGGWKTSGPTWTGPRGAPGASVLGSSRWLSPVARYRGRVAVEVTGRRDDRRAATRCRAAVISMLSGRSGHLDHRKMRWAWPSTTSCCWRPASPGRVAPCAAPWFKVAAPPRCGHPQPATYAALRAPQPTGRPPDTWRS